MTPPGAAAATATLPAGGATRPAWSRIGPWALLAVSVAVYATVSLLVFKQPFYVGARRLRFFDLHVYRGAARVVLHGGALYAARVFSGMRFTYPPFAALVLTPTRLAAITTDGAGSCAINVLVLLALLRLTPRLTDPSVPGRHRVGTWPGVALLGAVVLWSEPVTVAMGYGQIDLVIALLVVWDLSRPPGARARGIGIGLAAGLKLTPLIFIPYLLLTRQRRTAATATLTFLATIAAAFAVVPTDTAHYWGGILLDASRTGDIADPTNQSVMGAIARLTHSQHVVAGWTLAATVVAILGLSVAIRAGRRGDHGVGFAVCAIASLLVSPISWTHHWVLAIPAVLTLACWARQNRAYSVSGAVAALAVAGYCYLPETVTAGLRLDPTGQILTEPYVILALAAVLCVAVAGGRRAAGVNRRPGPAGAGRPGVRDPRPPPAIPTGADSRP
ncbi:MAG: glycosyltransferase 87 family protein [Solirubrobacteraceae bacterium]